MDVRVFNRLQQDRQLRLVVRFGSLLASDDRETVQCRLYAVGSFYVEVIHCSRQKKTIQVLAFDDGPILDQYLKRIDISSLLTGIAS